VSEPELLSHFAQQQDVIAQHYEQREFGKAIKAIMSLADQANQYIADKEPWVLAKQEGSEQQVQDICSTGLNMFRMLMIYLKPVLPVIAADAAKFLNDDLLWENLENPLVSHHIEKFKPLVTRIEASQIEAMLEDSKLEVAKEIALKEQSS
jgi:methionyl-tRNA synthetase